MPIWAAPISMPSDHGLISTGNSTGNHTGSLLNVDLDGHGSHNGSGGSDIAVVGNIVGSVLGGNDLPGTGATGIPLVGNLVNGVLGGSDAPGTAGAGIPAIGNIINGVLGGDTPGTGIPVAGDIVNTVLGGSDAPGTGGTELPVVGNILNIGNILGGGDGDPSAGNSLVHVDLGATDVNVGGSAGPSPAMKRRHRARCLTSTWTVTPITLAEVSNYPWSATS